MSTTCYLSNRAGYLSDQLIILSVWWLTETHETLDIRIVSCSMFDVFSAVQIGTKFKTTSFTQEFQSIYTVFRDIVTSTTNSKSMPQIHIFCY